MFSAFRTTVLAGIAAGLALPTPGHAIPFDYTVSGTTSFHFNNVTYNETISGSFTSMPRPIRKVTSRLH